MSLDIGSLTGHVFLNISDFERNYAYVTRAMAELGPRADGASTGTRRLGESLNSAGTAAGRAAAGINALSESSSKLTAAELRLSAAQSEYDAKLRSAGVSAADLARAQAAVIQAERGVTLATGETSSALARLQAAQLRQVAAAERLAAVQRDEKATTGQLAAAQAALIRATDGVANAETRMAAAAQASSVKLDESRSFAARYAAMRTPLLATGTALAAGFVFAAKEAVDFNAKMALVQTLSRASSGEMQQLRGAALTVGQAYGYTASQVADAEAELIKAGVSVKDIMGGALHGALTLAAAGQENVAAATETATIAMTQFHLAGSAVPHIADLLAAGADKALGSVADLSEGLKYGGLAASQAGWSLEQTVGTLAEFAQAGLMGSSAGSALQQMLRSLQHPTSAAQATMKQYGISVYDSNGQMLSATQIAGELHDKLGPLTDQQRQVALATMFSARSVRAATILTSDGAAVNERWIKTVNDQGFAAQQAGGKLNSLAGDWTKFRAAFQEAMIGVGDQSTGPLRSVVRDATKAIDAWNGLPEPVKSASLAFAGVAGAISLAGGALLVLLPKITAAKAALAELGIEADFVKGSLSGLGKVAAGLAIFETARHEIDRFTAGLGPAAPKIDALSASLLTFGKNGQVTGELAKDFGGNLNDLADQVKRIADPSVNQKILGFLGHLPLIGPGQTGSVKKATQDLTGMDQALAKLETSGHAAAVETIWGKLLNTVRSGGGDVNQFAGMFPKLSAAMKTVNTAGHQAAGGITTAGDAAKSAATSTKSATDAAKAYGDALHALADPLFAENQALQDLAAKQTAAKHAIDKYGASSHQAKQANLDLAGSALTVQAASAALAASVQDGTTSLSGARKMLRGWVADGTLTKAQADSIIASFGGLIGKAEKLSGMHPHLRVTADTSQAVAALQSVQAWLNTIHSKTISVDTQRNIILSGPGHQATVQGRATGGGLPEGWAAVGEAGPELVHKHGGQVQVFSHAASRAIIAASGMQAPGFAGGTQGSWQQAVAAVLTSIMRAVAPQITDQAQLAVILQGQTTAAAGQAASAAVAKAHVRELEEHARALQKDANAADNASSSAKHNKKALEEQAKAADAAAKHAQRLADQATKSYQRISQAASTAAQRAQQTAQTLVQQVQANADALQQAVTGFQTTVSQGLTGDYSLQSIWSNLGSGANLKNVQGNLSQVLTTAGQFGSDLRALAAKHADENLIGQIVGLGPVAGDQLARQLLAGGFTAVSTMESTLDQINTVAGRNADALAGAFYGPGEKAAAQFILGLEHRMPELRKALRPVYAELEGLPGSTVTRARGVRGQGDTMVRLLRDIKHQLVKNPELTGAHVGRKVREHDRRPGRHHS